MNVKEIAEIRRSYTPEKSNISTIRGCYVNEQKEIVSEFSQSLTLMPEHEAEKFLALLKKTLSGGVGKNLIDIEFSTEQVSSGEEHQLLMALKNSSLKDEDAVHLFFDRIVQSVSLAENYVILLAHDVYDVPYQSTDGGKVDDGSSDVYSYILCSICPVKAAKSALSYFVHENEFHSSAADRLVSPPELGFLFPTFDDRTANIYNALYYSRNIAQNQNEFVEAIFHSSIPMPAQEQKETFQTILSTTLADECRLDIVQAVHGSLQEMIEEHKVNKEEAPLTVSKGAVKRMLSENGVSDEHVEAFGEQYDTQFGAETTLCPQNIVDVKKMEVVTPDVTIHVSADSANLVQTRIIDGAKYIMIRAESGVELNGVPVHI